MIRARWIPFVCTMILLTLGLSSCEKDEPTLYRTSPTPLVYKYWLTQQTEIPENDPVRNMIVGELDVTLSAQADGNLLWSIRPRDFVVRAMVSGNAPPAIKKIDLSAVTLDLMTKPDGGFVSLSDPTGYPEDLRGVMVAVRQSFLDWVPPLPAKLATATAWSASVVEHLPLPPFKPAPVQSKLRFRADNKAKKPYGDVWTLGVRQELDLGGDTWLDMTGEQAPQGPLAQAANRLRFIGKGTGEGTFEIRPQDGRLIWSRLQSEVEATTEVEGENATQMQQRIKTTMEVFLKEADEVQRALQQAKP